MLKRTLVLLIFVVANVACVHSQTDDKSLIRAEVDFPDPSTVHVNGILGEAISKSEAGRLAELPTWKDGELIKMFSKQARAVHDKTDWYGEHAGKWLYSTARAVRGSNNTQLKELLLKTADFLVENQEPDGYMGTYGPAIRITNANASHLRSWDVWNLSYMTLGLLETNRYFPNEKFLGAAKKIGELFLKTFSEGNHDITEYGTRHGISATVMLDPVVELYKVTHDNRYLELGETIVKKMEANEGVRMLAVSLNGGDMENVGDGKAYQILWNLTALAKLYSVTGEDDYLKAVQLAWQNIADYHLTETGGPWGGIGKHLECFNKKYYWSPYGFIETCSTMSWIQLNKELLRITGEAKYAQEIERSAYNALLGAQFPDGVDWSYHTFSNGRRHAAHFNDCCPSSGALALEELPDMIYAKKGSGVALNVYTASEADIQLSNSNVVHVVQKTDYPFEGTIQVQVSAKRKVTFPLSIRIPEWASSATIKVNGQPVASNNLKANEYFVIDRTWNKKDVVDIEFPMEATLHHRSESAGAPQGGPALFAIDWISLTRGPLVYSAYGLIDGKNREQVVSLPKENPVRNFSTVEAPDGYKGPAYELKTAGGEQLLFVPYYEADGRKKGTWRLTWLQNSID